MSRRERRRKRRQHIRGTKPPNMYKALDNLVNLMDRNQERGWELVAEQRESTQHAIHKIRRIAEGKEPPP